jgi:hypothetical protein
MPDESGKGPLITLTELVSPQGDRWSGDLRVPGDASRTITLMDFRGEFNRRDSEVGFIWATPATVRGGRTPRRVSLLIRHRPE